MSQKVSLEGLMASSGIALEVVVRKDPMGLENWDPRIRFRATLPVGIVGALLHPSGNL